MSYPTRTYDDRVKLGKMLTRPFGKSMLEALRSVCLSECIMWDNSNREKHGADLYLFVPPAYWGLVECKNLQSKTRGYRFTKRKITENLLERKRLPIQIIKGIRQKIREARFSRQAGHIKDYLNQCIEQELKKAQSHNMRKGNLCLFAVIAGAEFEGDGSYHLYKHGVFSNTYLIRDTVYDPPAEIQNYLMKCISYEILYKLYVAYTGFGGPPFSYLYRRSIASISNITSNSNESYVIDDIRFVDGAVEFEDRVRSKWNEHRGGIEKTMWGNKGIGIISEEEFERIMATTSEESSP